MAQSAIASPAPSVTDLLARVKPRPIEGISALLLPYREDGQPDLEAFAAHLERTVAAGLKPSVNMDTGYVNLLTADERQRVLRVTAEVMRGRPFVAGAFVEGGSGPSTGAGPSTSSGRAGGSEGSVDELVALYCREAERVREYGGTPIIFQCSALKALPDAEVVEVYRAVAERMGEIIGFELGEMFAPFGWIYPLEVFAELIQIPGLVGMKHSSLDRAAEWERLALRDRVRPEFKLYTGNDLGIDMVMYGSDYLLGLSTFAPEAFGLRDRYWAAGDARFFALNDALQYLGAFAFRPPVPGYKHSAAQFLQLRGRIPTAAAHPASPRRPESDVPILREIAERIEALTS
jgi:dihydrodipicolinate synthase/N-acetylneuraminate lyase